MALGMASSHRGLRALCRWPRRPRCGSGDSVTLIAGRPALLRVFAVSDQPNWLDAPAVVVTLLQDDGVVFGRPLPPETEHIPAAISESNTIGSYDIEVPGSVIRPGVRMVVELDPEGVVPLAPGSRTQYPEEGSMELDVIEPPLLRQIFVPTLSTLSPNESVYDWTDGLEPGSPQLRMARTLLPVGTMEVEVGETYRTSADLTTASGWSTWIREMAVLYEQEGNGATTTVSRAFRSRPTGGWATSATR